MHRRCSREPPTNRQTTALNQQAEHYASIRRWMLVDTHGASIISELLADDVIYDALFHITSFEAPSTWP